MIELFYRFLYRKQNMTCDKPCDNCKCTAPCGHLAYDDPAEFEADPSGMATQQKKWLENPANFFDRYCANNPGAVECRIYED